MMGQQKATPYKTEPEKPIHEYEVLDNGDVVIKQTLVSKSYWKSREFLSLSREHEKALEETEYNMSDEFKTKMEEQKKEIVAEIEKLKPLIDESMKLTEIEYKKARKEGLLKSLKEHISAKEIEIKWFQNIWNRTKDEIKSEVIKELSEEEQGLFMKAMKKVKRKEGK